MIQDFTHYRQKVKTSRADAGKSKNVMATRSLLKEYLPQARTAAYSHASSLCNITHIFNSEPNSPLATGQFRTLAKEDKVYHILAEHTYIYFTHLKPSSSIACPPSGPLHLLLLSWTVRHSQAIPRGLLMSPPAATNAATAADPVQTPLLTPRASFNLNVSNTASYFI